MHFPNYISTCGSFALSYGVVWTIKVESIYGGCVGAWALGNLVNATGTEGKIPIWTVYNAVENTKVDSEREIQKVKTGKETKREEI